VEGKKEKSSQRFRFWGSFKRKAQGFGWQPVVNGIAHARTNGPGFDSLADVCSIARFVETFVAFKKFAGYAPLFASIIACIFT
jgi:hypothetical protein